MNIMTMLSAPASSGASPANQPRGAKGSGEFDALVNARTGANDDFDTQSSVPDTVEAATPADPEPTGVAALSAATIAMLSALDRSATMLSGPQAAATPAADTDEKPAGDGAVSPVGADPVAALQSAALAAVFAAAGKVLPAIVPATQADPSDTNAVASAMSPAPKTPTPVLSTAAVPMPALFNAIAAELRPALTAKTGPSSDPVESLAKSATESPDGTSVLPTASTMIRDLAALMANSVDSLRPADVAVVDRHLNLARGDAWLNELAHDIAATAANGGRLKFGLAPETLGRLDVEIRQSASGVSVHMTTRTETARDMLTAAQPRIVDEIRAQGVRVAGTEVSTDASGFGGDRAGSTPRQPTGLPIEAVLSTPDATPPQSPELVADGRYA